MLKKNSWKLITMCWSKIMFITICCPKNSFKDDDNEEKDLDPLLLTWQPRKKTQSIMARKL